MSAKQSKGGFAALFPQSGACFAVVMMLALSLYGETAEVSMSPEADTALFEFDPGYNMGGQRDLPAGVLGNMANRTRSRILTRFPVAERVPAGSRIESAELRWLVVRLPSGDSGAWFSLHRVLSTWGEGAQRGDNPGGAPAENGEATWLHRFHPDSSWTEPGGALGTDFGEEELASVLVEREDEDAVFILNAAGIADLQSALDEPDQHHGWLLRATTEGTTRSARRFASREHRTRPPVLIIRYIAPNALGTPELDIKSTGVAIVELSFRARPEVAYELERAEGLNISDWEPWRSFEPVAQETLLSVEDTTAGSGRRFYRLAARSETP